MARLRLLIANRYTAPGTVLAASTAAPALPATASQDPDRSYVWRSLSEAGTQALDIDLGSVQAVSAVALANVKLLSGGAVQLYERGDGSTPGSSTPVVALPAADADRRVTYAFPTPQSHRHWRLLWTNPGAITDYAELGYCHLGEYFEPAINVTVPIELSEVDPAIVRQSVDRQRSTVARTRYTLGRFSWMEVGDSDRAALRAVWAVVGASLPLFAILDQTRAWTAWLVYLQAALEERFSLVDGRYDVSMDWEEAT